MTIYQPLMKKLMSTLDNYLKKKLKPFEINVIYTMYTQHYSSNATYM